MEKAIKTAKSQGLQAKDIAVIEAKKADIMKRKKDLKAQAPDSENDLFVEPNNKKRKATMLDNDEIGHLDFKPSTAQNTHLPISLATQSVKDVTIELPVVIQLKDGTSAILTTNVNKARVGKSFWVAIKKKLQNWTAFKGENGFEVFRESEKKEL